MPNLAYAGKTFKFSVDNGAVRTAASRSYTPATLEQL